MINQITVANLDRFNATMALYMQDLGKAAKDVVVQQSRLLATELMHQTPPFPDGTDGTTKTGELVGKEAVRKGIFKCVSPVDAVITTKFSNPSIAKIIAEKNIARLNAVKENIPSLKRYEVVPFHENLHRDIKHKYSQYKNIGNQYRMTFDKTKLMSYVRKVQKRVGLLKSGWALAVVGLGGKVPAWVSKHLPYTLGKFVNNSHLEKPQVTMDNLAPVRIISKLNYAVAKRVREMQEDLAYKLKYLANQRNKGT